MIRNVLVPLDGSPLSDRAIPLAVRVARFHGARLTLLSVYETRGLLPPPTMAIAEAAVDTGEHERVERRLERIARRIMRAAPVHVGHVVRQGVVIDEIVAAVDALGSDLIVMNTHGRGGIARAWLGSVTDGLLRRVHIPVLLQRGALTSGVQGDASLPFARVLVGLDGSAESEAALEDVIHLLGDSASELSLLHVIAPAPVMLANLQDQTAIDQIRAQYLEPLASRWRTTSRSVHVDAISHNSAARALLDHAQHVKADLIVVRTHGRRGVARTILGSVADKIIRVSRVPVLVVPTR
jgi:nucleotide-binding universal stress UspA family protein